MRKLTLMLFVLAFTSMAWAQNNVEKKAQDIDKKLIAPCCWTSTLDQHFSEVAEQMKDEIREKLAQGQTEDQILQSFEKKYGERILSEPKAAGFNMTVWIFPVFALAIGAFLLSRVLRKTQPVEEVTNTMTLQTNSPERDEKYKAIIDKELYRS